MNRRLVRPAAALFSILMIAGQATAAPKLKIDVSQRNQPWSITKGPADIAGGAGSDFAAEYESAVNEKTLDVTNPTGNWRVDVRRSDTNWDPNIRLYIRRTDTGTGTGTISGGTVYVEITTTDSTFYSGTLERKNVALQFKVTGAYAANGVLVDTYLTSIIYTVTDNL